MIFYFSGTGNTRWAAERVAAATGERLISIADAIGGDVRMVADGSREFPTWIHNGECLTCFACYHHCPKKAIDYGHRTQHKGQYYFKKI